VYGGNDRLCTEDGIEVLPVRDFAQVLDSGSLWP
jgi:hypothetical protein